MKMRLIYIFICSAFCIQGLVSQQLFSVARIYPNKPDITVDVHTDLTLGCRGAEPMRWTFRDAVNAPHYITSRKNITYMYNGIELEYKYETMLTVYNVSGVNVGFYYCHGEKVDFNTPRRSSGIYVFVHDDNNLSVITSKQNTFLSYEWIEPIPCRPTSPDTNVLLTCDYGPFYTSTIFVTPSNYSGVKQGKDYIIRYHPYHGFTIEHLLRYSFARTCTCVFTRKKTMFSIHMKLLSESDLSFSDISIEGPNTADVGTDITLQCILLSNQYFPYDKYLLQWDIPNNRKKLVANLRIIKLKSYVIQMNTMTVKNISREDEGVYKCQMDTRSKFGAGSNSKLIFINDNYIAPRIHSPNGGDIEINSGANITVRCESSLPVSWITRSKAKKYIEYISNNKTGLYESHLHLMEPRYEHTGFFECFQTDFGPDRPFKTALIYIYVNDEQNLYVTRTKRNYAVAYTNETLPCLPTSRNVNVSLSLEYQVRDRTGRYGPKQMINPVIYAFDPREGFTVLMPGPGYGFLTATCKFATKTANNTLAILFNVQGREIKSEPFVTGPQEDFVFVGQSLELSCAVLVNHNVPDDALRWITPNPFTSSNITLEKRRIWSGKVLISKLILNNVKAADEGRYLCVVVNDNSTAGKFISVYEKFLVTPIIEVFQYDDAYIGQSLVLRCKVAVDHNIGFQMSWTTPNGTETKTKNTEYIPKIENISGESSFQIDNVTDANKGNYTCFVFDFKNRTKNITKHILVKRGLAPRIITSNFNNQEAIDVQLDETAKLTCFAEGDPQPEITWIKGSSIVQRLGQHYGFASNNSEFTVQYIQRRDAGLYTCIAENPFGRDSRAVNLHVDSGSLSGYIATALIILILCVAVAVLLALWSYRQKKLRKQIFNAGFISFQSGQIQSINPFLKIQEQANLLSYDTKWEIPSSQIKLGRNLGSGYFGLVVEATVSNFFDDEPERIVAVKMLHQNSNFIELNSLICELKILAHLGEHVNLINLLGACAEKIAEGKLLVVLDYCKHGNLRNYLIENRCNFINLMDPATELICLPADYTESLQELSWHGVSTLQLLRWALQIAHGMEFLAAKQILHGDLAARNVLLAENYVPKISDFGLSKTLSSSGYYTKKSQCPLPVKWMAIESIRDKTFSTWSDIWAFGVVLWELFSLARTPYAELEPDFRFYRKLERGYRLERPEYSTKEMYQMMRECWHTQPQCRPTFSMLVHALDDLLQESNSRCSLNNETVDAAHRTAFNSLAARPDDAATPDCIALDILVPTETCKRSNSVENTSN